MFVFISKLSLHTVSNTFTLKDVAIANKIRKVTAPQRGKKLKSLLPMNTRVFSALRHCSGEEMGSNCKQFDIPARY
jgi:hypothetical protein